MDQRIKIIKQQLLGRSWGSLTNYTVEYRRSDGEVQRLDREVYDHGNGAALLLFDPDRNTVLLVRQFRFPVMLNGDDADILEACAGLLDGDAPEDCARRESLEETGHDPIDIRHICDVYASPGSLAEKISLFIGHYGPATRKADGGGVAGEGEDIELVELSLEDALSRIGTGGITDAKTIILLQRLALERRTLDIHSQPAMNNS